MHKQLNTYLDGLDAAVDGRGYGLEHEQARIFVEGACAMVEQLARLTTPTDDVIDQEAADDIMADLDDETLCSDSSALYELVRQARALPECALEETITNTIAPHEKIARLHDTMTDMAESDMGHLTEKLAGRFHQATTLIRSIHDELKGTNP